MGARIANSSPGWNKALYFSAEHLHLRLQCTYDHKVAYLASVKKVAAVYASPSSPLRVDLTRPPTALNTFTWRLSATSTQKSHRPRAPVPCGSTSAPILEQPAAGLRARTITLSIDRRTPQPSTPQHHSSTSLMNILLPGHEAGKAQTGLGPTRSCSIILRHSQNDNDAYGDDVARFDSCTPVLLWCVFVGRYRVRIMMHAPGTARTTTMRMMVLPVGTSSQTMSMALECSFQRCRVRIMMFRNDNDAYDDGGTGAPVVEADVYGTPVQFSRNCVHNIMLSYSQNDNDAEPSSRAPATRTNPPTATTRAHGSRAEPSVKEGGEGTGDLPTSRWNKEASLVIKMVKMPDTTGNDNRPIELILLACRPSTCKRIIELLGSELHMLSLSLCSNSALISQNPPFLHFLQQHRYFLARIPKSLFS
ncbi:uncharacterized protein BDZ99DRAFT_514151 [Mytilinidion resinicola]|uniref:Uncharacterized protein n=1 Tax=Mytilinidion resinicola TaxID=574789 RepID=A0A6A6ZAR4_9PEZI|nr:uncharacterized protein BDZ99DRAFT_514151 [Mytilinidion resinicola]KAF2817928.1 hypothetical protein BDZ99DRAFT_514151 [Mytilinidion resinicola]